MSVTQLSNLCCKPMPGQQECTERTALYACVKCTFDPTVQIDCTAMNGSSTVERTGGGKWMYCNFGDGERS